ncbi:MAG: Protein TolB [Candidatus Omnitrophica bacterium]|nr:Protein TolB [Candidatus Omnitrophota bacterium]
MSYRFAWVIALAVCMTGCASSEEFSLPGKMVFQSDRKEDHQFGTFMLQDKQITYLGDLISPALSPDGNKIAAYTLDTRELVISDNKGAIQKKISIGGKPGRPLWTPDGQSIVVVNYRGYDELGPALVMIDIATAQIRTLHEVQAGCSLTYHTISPDGRRILFTSSGGSDPKRRQVVDGLYLLDIESLHVEKIYPYLAVSGMWLPDSKHIVFDAYLGVDGRPITDLHGALLIMNIETKQIRKLHDMDFPAWDGIKLSKDGKYFYLAKNIGHGGSIIVLMPYDDPRREIHVTRSVPNWLGYSNDTKPDWWQGE